MSREPDIVERLRDQAKGDHSRGCQGREYHCDCGYDLTTEGLLEMAADEIDRLRAALKPFARNVDAVSLSEALGHIERQHLHDARAALDPKP